MLVGVFLLFIAITICVSAKRTLYGCQFLLISRILVPECVRMTPVADISLNTAVILILAVFLVKDVLVHNDSINKPFGAKSYTWSLAIFVVGWFVVTLFADVVDTKYQFGRLIQFTITDVVPVIVFYASIKTKQDVELTIKVLFTCTLISCVYGCMTWIIGKNPYVFFINSLYSTRDDLFQSVMLQDGRGITATSGTFEHANGWGYFLPIAFALFYYLNEIRVSRLNVILLFLLSICVVICSKRSALVSYMAFWAFYFLMGTSKRKVRLLLYGAIGITCLYFIVSVFPYLSKAKGLIESSVFFWDDSLRDRNDIGGSSWEMRVQQITYPFYEIEDNILFGHGYGWSSYYVNRFGFHPIMYGFENLLSESLCNGGLFGTILWTYIFLKSYKFSISNATGRWQLMYIRLLTIVQFTIAMATGLSYFIFYGLFIVIINKLSLLKDEKNIGRNSNIQLQGHC